MKTRHLIFFAIIYAWAINGQTYENKEVGISLTLHENWKSVPVLESNKPHSILEAIRNNNNQEFLSLVIFPTTNLPVNKESISIWEEETFKAFGERMSKTKARLTNINDLDWFFGQGVFDKSSNFLIYNAFQNGYSYSLTFMSKEKNDKQFVREVKSIMNSVTFSTPSNINLLKEKFQTLQTDTNTGMKIPTGFNFVNQVSKREVASFALSLYKNLLSQGNTDYVLVSTDYFMQLFCMNIKIMPKVVNKEVVNLISKVTGLKLTKEPQVKYEELFIGLWDKSPENVFLYKFRLTKQRTQTTHYIFYLIEEDQTKVVKIQLSSLLENDFKNCFNNLILNNIKK